MKKRSTKSDFNRSINFILVLDAIGKPPSGLLQGAITMFGNHDECLKIRAPDDEDDFDEDDDAPVKPKFKEFFRGQYCVLELKPWLPPKPHYYGLAERIESLKRDGDEEGVSFFHFSIFRN